MSSKLFNAASVLFTAHSSSSRMELVIGVHQTHLRWSIGVELTILFLWKVSNHTNTLAVVLKYNNSAFISVGSTSSHISARPIQLIHLDICFIYYLKSLEVVFNGCFTFKPWKEVKILHLNYWSLFCLLIISLKQSQTICLMVASSWFRILTMSTSSPSLGAAGWFPTSCSELAHSLTFDRTPVKIEASLGTVKVEGHLWRSLSQLSVRLEKVPSPSLPGSMPSRRSPELPDSGEEERGGGG